MKRSKTSPLELGNCCQERAGPPAAMRQYWAQLCIKTNSQHTIKQEKDTSWQGSVKYLKKSTCPGNHHPSLDLKNKLKVLWCSSLHRHPWEGRPINSNLQRVKQLNHLNPDKNEGIQHCSCSDTRARLYLHSGELCHPICWGKNSS